MPKEAKPRRYRTTYPSDRRDDASWKRAAVAYAAWWADRQGISFPAGRAARVHWDFVCRMQAPGKKIRESRIRSVEWGHEETVPDDRHPRGYYALWVCDLEIELPHWDWQPEVIDCSLAANEAPEVLAVWDYWVAMFVKQN